MASDYGLNFGFRRSDESVRNVSEGRFKSPAGVSLLMGTAVQIDPATPGYLKACAINAALTPGFSGLLIQEEMQFPSVYEKAEFAWDSFDLGVAKRDRLSVLTSGAGTKVWFKNTASSTRADGRSIPAVTICTTTGLAVGERVGWDGSKWIEVNGSTVTEEWFVVTAVTPGGGYFEGVLLK